MPEGDSNIKKSWRLFGKFELHPERRPSWAWLEPALFDQSLFKKETRTSAPDSRDRRKSSLKKEQTAFLYYFFKCTLQDTWTAKNSDVSSSAPLSETRTP